MSNESLVDRATKDLGFLRDDLDDAWLNQDILFVKYASEANKLEREVSRAKAALETVEAKLSARIRSDLSLNGIRATSTLIESKVKQDAIYIRGRTIYDNAKSDLELARHVIEAFRHRKDMIIQASKREQSEFDRLGESSFRK